MLKQSKKVKFHFIYNTIRPFIKHSNQRRGVMFCFVLSLFLTCVLSLVFGVLSIAGIFIYHVAHVKGGPEAFKEFAEKLKSLKEEEQ